MKIGFVGMGNMAYAMLNGLINNGFLENSFYEVNESRKNGIENITGIKSCNSIEELVKFSEIMVLAVKPYQYEMVSKEIVKFLNEKQIVVSITVGLTISKFKNMLNEHGKVVISMPNTPALVGAGMTGVCYDENNFDEYEKKEIEKFFKSFGEMEIIKEEQIPAVICLSGSSPAYVDLFIETLADVGVKYGLTRDLAYKFASKAVEGSAKMISETKEHPAVLKDRVCSPSGTTIEAVEALEKSGFRASIWEAGRCCYEKAKNM